MPAPRDPSALVKAARLYYVDNQSQQDVARALGTSRSNVSRMLAAALAQGIVEIRINDPGGRDRDLEQTLKIRFGLRDARVAQRVNRAANAEDRVGALAAQVLAQSLRDDMTVALSWGHALQAMVWNTTADQDSVHLVQLVGGLSAVAVEISGQELVRELAARLGASYRYLHAPAVLTTSEARDALLAERSIVQALDSARHADIAFVGVGTPAHGSSAAILAALSLSPQEEKEFWAAQPVGDIAARYFDAAGREIHGAVHDRVLAVTLGDLARIPTVVGVASGRVKVSGVLGALRGHHIDVLVCDEGLARALLADAEHLPARETPPEGAPE